MKLSNQAMGAIMLVLQKSIMELSDVTSMLRNFELQLNENEELFVTNPPMIKFDKEDKEDYN
jgi:hypothetical protein